MPASRIVVVTFAVLSVIVAGYLVVRFAGGDDVAAPTTTAVAPEATTSTTAAASPPSAAPRSPAVPSGGLGAVAALRAVIPSSAGMAPVVESAPTIGFAAYATVQDPHAYRPLQALDVDFDFHIDERSTSNAFFREWLIYTAGADTAMWQEMTPSTWDATSSTGFPTFAEGLGQLPVVGVSRDHAAAYCKYVSKRLPTEIEWELAAVAGAFVPDLESVQNWVDEPEIYGPVEGAQSVLRGTFGTEDLDVHYRTIGPDNPVFRTAAGVRCAADEVRTEIVRTQPGTTLYEDDFADLETGWESTTPDGVFSVGYHPTDVYHLEASTGNVKVMAVTGSTYPADSSISSGTELRKPVDGFGQFRWGIAGRVSDAGHVLLTVIPVVEGENLFLEWCLSVSDVDVVAGERANAVITEPSTDLCPGSIAQGRQQVESFINQISMSFKGSTPSIVLDGVAIGLAPGLSVDLPPGDAGFFVESFDEARATHVHFEGILVATS